MDTGITATRAPEKIQVPPPNPHYVQPAGVAQEHMTLDEGLVMLHMPMKLSAESYRDFEYWMTGIVRQARRRAGLAPTPTPEGE